MQITIQVRNVYGVNKAYPVCDRAKAFAAIAGTKTLTDRNLLFILQIGVDIVVQGVSGMVISAGPQAPHDVALLDLAS